MNSEMLKYYSLMGKLQSAISKADDLDTALKSVIGLLKVEYNVDDLIVWYRQLDDYDILRPNYWICPTDLTSIVYKKGEGIVGKTYESNSVTKIFKFEDDLNRSTRAEFERVFPGINVHSMVCVPLSNKHETLGCLQFINEKGSDKFSEEDADLFEIIGSLIAIQIDENTKISTKWVERNKIYSIRNIKRDFNHGSYTSHVLRGVNLDVYEGEFLAFLGESGCGKSTLLNIIGGLDRPTEGSVIFDGTDICELSQDELSLYRRKNIGFVFQSYNLMPNLTARQNLNLIGELVDNPMDADETLRMVGLNGKYNSYPSQLSGGQQQRISIARAIVKNPRVIMADEPTAALDYETSIEVLSVMEDIVKNGTTLIMVTHNEEITRMADRVVRFREGRPYEISINSHPVQAKDLVW